MHNGVKPEMDIFNVWFARLTILLKKRFGVSGFHVFPLGVSCFPSTLSVAPVRMGRAFLQLMVLAVDHLVAHCPAFRPMAARLIRHAGGTTRGPRATPCMCSLRGVHAACFPSWGFMRRVHQKLIHASNTIWFSLNTVIVGFMFPS